MKPSEMRVGREKRVGGPNQPSLAIFFGKKTGREKYETSQERVRDSNAEVFEVCPSRERPGTRVPRWRNRCMTLVERLLEEDEEGWFAGPVNAEQLGLDDYFRIVTEPMDLGTIKANLKQKAYVSPEAFARDVWLVFDNARRYNESPDHPVHQLAVALAGSFGRAFNALIPRSGRSREEGDSPSRATPVPRRGGLAEGPERDGEGLEESDVEILAASGAGWSTKRPCEMDPPLSVGASTGEKLHPFFAKRTHNLSQRENFTTSLTAGSTKASITSALESDLPRTDAAGRSATGKGMLPGSRPTEETSCEERGATRSSQGRREMSDEELLAANDYFLSQALSKRKASLLRAHAEEVERRMRREWLESLNNGREMHPFFEKARAGSSGRSELRRSEGCVSMQDERAWTCPLFPEVTHVHQEDETEQQNAQVPADTISLGELLIPKLGAMPAFFGLDGGPLPLHASRCLVSEVTKTPEENRPSDAGGAEEASRGIMLRNADLNERGRSMLLPVSDSNAQHGAAESEQTVYSLASSAEIDAKVIRRHLKWMKRQRERGSSGVAAQWVDRYRPDEPDALVWPLRQAALSLQQWLEDWQEWRLTGSRGHSTKQKRKKRLHERSKRDAGDIDEDEWNDGEPRTTTLVCGPSGIGKSAVVYATAARLGFEVIEVNTSQLRSGVEIKKLFSEATQSQHIRQASSVCTFDQTTPAEQLWLTKSSKGANGLQKRKGAKQKDEDEVVWLEQPIPRSRSANRMTLILIEEVDLVFEEDVGFHRALREFMSSAKWPLVLTANHPPDWLSEMECCRTRTVLPCPTVTLALMLSMIWATEGLPGLPREHFCALACSSRGDVRSAIMSLQMWSFDFSPKRQGNIGHPGAPYRSGATALSLLQTGKSVDFRKALKDQMLEQKRLQSRTHADCNQSLPEKHSIFGYHCPVVDSVHPLCGSHVGGTRITIRGRHFLQASDDSAGAWAPVDVRLGSLACLHVKVLSDTEITAVTPALPRSLYPGQLPVIVTICRLINSANTWQLACRACFRFQSERRPEDRNFPDLKLPGHHLKRWRSTRDETPTKQLQMKGKHVREKIQVETKAEGEEQYQVNADDQSGNYEGQVKRRRVVLESESEDEEVERRYVQNDLPSSSPGAVVTDEVRDDKERGTATCETDILSHTDIRSQAQAVIAKREGRVSYSRDERGDMEEISKEIDRIKVAHEKLTEQLDVVRAEVRVGKTEKGRNLTGGAVRLQQEKDQDSKTEALEEGKGNNNWDTGEHGGLPDAGAQKHDQERSVATLPRRLWREVLRPPARGASCVDTCALEILSDHADALSCCDLLETLTPGLDGDDYVQAPCSSLLRHVIPAKEISEENSPWPRGSGGGHEVSTLLQILLARRQRPVCFEICFPPVDSTMMESLKRKRALDVVLALMPSCFSLRWPSRQDVQVDYTPLLRSMQVADRFRCFAVQDLGRGCRKKRTYWDRVLSIEMKHLEDDLVLLASDSPFS